jgi:hypothetical protein
LSISPDDPAEGEGGRTFRVKLALRAFAAFAAFISLFVLWSGERISVAHDLQLVAEASVRPGAHMALRSFVFRDVEAPQGPTLARTPVTVRLFDGEGRELSRTTLRETALDTMEGELAIPGNAAGELVLEARARLDDDPELICRRPLRVADDAPALPNRGREAGPLQQWSVGEVSQAGMLPAPHPFWPRVLGGACVPEQRCTLLVWMGEPAAALAVRPSPAFTMLGKPLPDRETTGLVELNLRVHGLEAELVLEARQGEELVAVRPVRLPVALGDVALFPERTLLSEAASTRIALALPPGREHAIVDLYSQGHLVASRTFPNVVPDLWVPLSLGSLSGLVHVQARVDRFSNDGAGARLIYVREPGRSDADVLHELARLAAGQASGEPTSTWTASLPTWAASDLERTAAYLLAPLENERVILPPAASGRPAQLARVGRAKNLARFGVSLALVLSALVVGASLMQRGLRASDEASIILEAARDETSAVDSAAGTRQPPDGPIADLRPDRLRVITLALAVALAFVAAALLVAAKSLWF